ETEILVEEVLKAFPAKTEDPHILDIGTGSGNIAIALAKDLPHATITAVEKSEAALKVAKGNACTHHVERKIHFILGDILKGPLFKDAPQFDVIVSNPPYIPSGDIQRLPDDVRREPRGALDGGWDGLDYYRMIINGFSGFLRDGGVMFLEIGDGQQESLIRIFQESSKYVRIHFINDYVGTPRIARITK
ncbi:MAG: peptide chain release factor N(5)-glutamine methyltransferase, partial [Candidatus Omnitrophica bacterium]|nr:peptide chain release factor N(5)-glutamine methyltransferase [Candidatus Omnitrophota bacterium]